MTEEKDIKMATPPIPHNTMLKYFKKLPSKNSLEEPSSTGSTYFLMNKQHVDNFNADNFDRQILLDHHHVEDGGCGGSSADVDQKSNDHNYLSTISHGIYKPFKVIRQRGCMRAKLLQFHEDVRPPYFGTWRKRSRLVTGRRPFGCDTNVFDYDCDSEAEWDIGGPGESLKDSEEEDDHPDDYEIDMKTFVPHGYVSDDELEEEGGGEPTTGGRNRQQQQQQLNQQADNKSNMKPILLGISFDSSTMEALREFEGVTCAIISSH